jgi:hypothetical protein
VRELARVLPPPVILYVPYSVSHVQYTHQLVEQAVQGVQSESKQSTGSTLTQFSIRCLYLSMVRRLLVLVLVLVLSVRVLAS